MQRRRPSTRTVMSRLLASTAEQLLVRKRSSVSKSTSSPLQLLRVAPSSFSYASEGLPTPTRVMIVSRKGVTKFSR